MEERTIHLLIIDESSNNAELLTNILRNAGLAVRAKRIEDGEDMQEALDEQRWDVILSTIELSGFSAKNAIDLLRRNEKDVPVIVIANGKGDMSAADALGAGAVDFISNDEPEHLQCVVKREYHNLRERRAHRLCKKSFRESEKRCRSLLDSSRDAITYVHEGMHIYANPVYLEMFGYADQDEIEGMPIMDMVAPDDHQRFKEFLRSFNKANEELHGDIEVKGIRTDGGKFDALMEFSPATIEGETCTQIIIRQQSNKELQQQLNVLSKQDLLTGLYNRQHIMEELDNAVSRAETESINSSLIYLELDNYESIKSSVGIAHSDLLLTDIAKLLQDRFQEPDVAARFEGHIFTVLVDEPDTSNVETIADEIRQLIADNITEVGNESVMTTCSIGISLITESSDSAQVVLSRANHACNFIRGKGGNGVHVHSPTEDEAANIERNEVWIKRIQNALDKGRFFLVYQPIVSLHGDSSEIYEIFLRMRDEEGNIVLPAKFLLIAEHADMMKDIDRWVIGNAIRTMAEQRRKGKQPVFFIKLSGNSITDKTLPSWVSEQLKSERLAGDALAFEMSESLAMTHLAQAKNLLSGLKQLRCHIVLEHFGSGLNSFNALKHLNVDYLKVDGSLIEDLSSNEKNQVAVKSITEMAHSMGKLTIAEFVQDANSLAVLWQCGINYIQGYFLQEPSESLDYDFNADDS